MRTWAENDFEVKTSLLSFVVDEVVETVAGRGSVANITEPCAHLKPKAGFGRTGHKDIQWH